MKYSIIVPVYNRPDEVDELLQSLVRQTMKDFEVIIVEDGSHIPCKDICAKYADVLDLHYYYKDNSGPGQSRNYGADRSHGEWLIILDSDVVLPDGYLQAINEELAPHSPVPYAAFGGPDASHPSFTSIQKAISYSMTSFFTTGGIRGGKKKLDKFYPRSFNMGIRSDVYRQLGGFSRMRFGEDIDFSYRIVEAGHATRLIPEAWVWHKRRTDLRKFWRQVYNSGIARINLEKRHPGTLKLVHLLPMVFTLGVFFCCMATIISIIVTAISGQYLPSGIIGIVALSPLLLYSTIICTHSTLQNKSLRVGLLSVPAAFVQLMGYGCGFLSAWWKRCVLGQDEFQAYEKNFYK